MSLKDIQKDVDEWIQKLGGKYFSPLAIVAALSEEHGELAREINNRYGDRVKKSPEDTADIGKEIADIIFNLCCMANSQGISLQEYWDKKMDKQYGRDKDRFKEYRNEEKG
jgi:NTP pyrophosphatase (non-canonical NTP hydrolase)